MDLCWDLDNDLSPDLTPSEAISYTLAIDDGAGATLGIVECAQDTDDASADASADVSTD